MPYSRLFCLATDTMGDREANIEPWWNENVNPIREYEDDDIVLGNPDFWEDIWQEWINIERRHRDPAIGQGPSGDGIHIRFTDTPTNGQGAANN